MLRTFSTHITPRRGFGLRRRRTSIRRRGVSAVLAMMYLVIFGSLAAAMAVVAQGNLRTADSSLRVSRAMGAAESGLAFASRRLQSEGGRFVIDKGVIDGFFAQDVWDGTINVGADGDVEVLPAEEYDSGPQDNSIGLSEALLGAHLADSAAMTMIVEPGDAALPAIDGNGALETRPIRLSDEPNAPYFRLRYEMLENQPFVRVTSIGVDGEIERTLQMDFRLTKRIEFAIISPNRIMIGKNVRVEGPLGSRYGVVPGELDSANGDPLVMRSDFYYLDPDLSDQLDIFFDLLAVNDVDGDNRLRPNHPIEGDDIGSYPFLEDMDLDEYIDDFDLFLAAFDADNDRDVVYDQDKAAAAGLGNPPIEFDVDDQLGRLIDMAVPDRDGDGEVTAADVSLGYNNGVIDIYDRYAKLHGRLAFAVARADWDAANGESYQSVVNGPIRPSSEDPPVSFEVSDEDLREIDAQMLDDSLSWAEGMAAAGSPFADQVTDNLTNNPLPDPASFTAAGDNDYEPVPFGSAGAYDYYRRPIYENMVFNDVSIPIGANALFRNCRFVGVTFIETTADCDDPNWNYAGALEQIDNGDGTFSYELKYPYIYAESGGVDYTDTKPLSNNIRFDDCVFVGSVVADIPAEYTHWRNKLQFTGSTRFHIDETDPELEEPGELNEWILDTLDAMDDGDKQQLAKSSVLTPEWSIDVGNFDNEVAVDPEDTPTVRLKGIIVAGIMDVRGTADVHGTMMMTFRPTANAGPLYYGGLPDAFNTTIGYFGPADGDGEGVDPDDDDFPGFGEITLRYNPDALLPDGIPWAITVEAENETYTEGGGN